MLAEIVAIGDELTSGARLDTNSQWISQRLGELGVAVAFHTTVDDSLSRLACVLRTAIDRADLVVASGGLGPTADDLTREALAQATGRPLQPDEKALRAIRDRFESRGIAMPPRNRLQALLPEGSRIIDNPHGTAPGICLRVPRNGQTPSLVVALPGVPAELFEMWEGSVKSLIREQQPEPRLILQHRIKCFGAGESHVEAMLPDLIRRGRVPSVGITVSQATITLRITAAGSDEDECRRLIAPTIATIRESLGQLVFGEEDDELEHVVGRLLARRKQCLTTVECGTGGLVASWLDAASEGAHWYAGGRVLSCRSGFEWIGVQDDGSRQDRMEEAVRRLARSQRERSRADHAIAVVGPLPIERNDAVFDGYVVALSNEQDATVSVHAAAGHPELVKVRAAKQALNALRLVLNDGA